MIELKLNTEEINTILIGLLELPAKMSMDIITKIRGQALPQIAELESLNAREPEKQP